MTAPESIRLKYLYSPSGEANRPNEEVLSVYRDHGVIPKSSRSDNFNKTPENVERYLFVRPGDLVVNRMKAWQGSLGVSPYRGIVSGDYEVLRPTSGYVSGRYMHYALRSRHMIGEYRMRSTGIRPSQWRLYWDQMGDIRIPLPPLEQQEQIADYLDRETAQIDALITEQQRLVETLQERRGVVVDQGLRAQPEAQWTRSALKYMLEGIDQGVSPQAEAALADDDSWGVLKSGCVNRGVFREDEHKRLPDDFTFDARIRVSTGDVIVSRASGSPDLVGSCATVRSLTYRLILSDKLFRLRPAPSVDDRFLVWLLNSRSYRTQVRQAISGAQGLANNLPLAALRSFEMHYPPLDEQRRIADRLDEQTTRIDTLIAESERLIELSQERRAALITAAVTGRIDVPREG